VRRLLGRPQCGASSPPFPLECRFEEYSEDTELNRLVKAAHRWLLQVPQLDAQIARKLRHGFRAFGNVASVEYIPGSVPEPVLTRLNSHWQAAGRLARLILGQRSLRDQKGAVIGTTFNVDMNALFERFVEAIVDEEARRANLRLVPCARRRRQFTKKIPIRPDLILHGGGRDLAVTDVKYKELKPAEWPHADLYQLLAYCVSLNLSSGLLIYASDRSHEEHTVEQAGVSLGITGVEMSGSPRDLETRVRRAARHLVLQAARRRSMQTTAV